MECSVDRLPVRGAETGTVHPRHALGGLLLAPSLRLGFAPPRCLGFRLRCPSVAAAWGCSPPIAAVP